MVARRLGNVAAAEDAVQEALTAAVRTWPERGRPDDPRRWLMTVAVHKAVDQMRSDAARREREITVLLREPAGAEVRASDDTVALMTMCCHPALSPASAVALTLRAVGGLTTAEIARAFGVPETTMAQRISRAKRTIAASGADFTVPTEEQLGPRLRQVMHVVYLLFTEGHTASSGSALVRVDLADEAVRLARILHDSRPFDPESTALLALLLLTDARRAARVTPAGDLVPLPEQDRESWDAAEIAEGLDLLAAAGQHGPVGEYQPQAMIAAVHDRAATAGATDWVCILSLYGLLESMTGNPVVRVNRAVATAMVHGPAAALAVLEGVGSPVRDGHRVLAVRAHLLEMSGDTAGALAHYRHAADRATSLPEQRYLRAQASRLVGAALHQHHDADAEDARREPAADQPSAPR